MLLGLLFAAGPAGADVVYLVNGSRLVVDGWHEADDAVELVVAGGRVWVDKAEVTRIEATRLPEAETAGAAPPAAAVAVLGPPPAPTPLELDEARRRMLALLNHGEALFADAFLSPVQKLRALRWLEERWREFAVPAVLHVIYGQGQRALRLTAEAFTAEADGAAEARARLLEAADEVALAERDVRDAVETPEVQP
jgi:hypothetical protein